MCFDLETLKPMWRIKACERKENEPMITINSLNFTKSNNNIFVSGTRDGYVTIWDKRDISKSVLSLEAHCSKINTTEFVKEDTYVISSGRDNTIRLWDMRMMNPGKITPVMKYSSHKCDGYNIPAKIFNDETNIITGSEDKDIVIYDINTGDVVNVLRCPSPNHIIHIVDATVNSSQIKIVSSSIEKMDIIRWSPVTKVTNEPEDVQKEELLYSQERKIIDSLMTRFGDKILELFHKYNVTLSSAIDLSGEEDDDGNLNIVAELSEAIINSEHIMNELNNNNFELDSPPEPVVNNFNEDSIGNTTTEKKTKEYEYYKKDKI
jgi:WD40 repeat protein